MTQIEADVVIEINGTEGNCCIGEVHPYWECEKTSKELVNLAGDLALNFVERTGVSGVRYVIHDWRETK